MIQKLKSGQPVTKDWITINQLIEALTSAERRLAALEHPNERKFQILGQDNPFQIIKTSTWLKYKVKTGYVITTGNPIIPTDVETEFTLTSGVLRYWLYVELTSTTAVIKKSSTLIAWSVNKIPIGWVDTSTNSASNRATIFQIVRDDIFVPCA